MLRQRSTLSKTEVSSKKQSQKGLLGGDDSAKRSHRPKVTLLGTPKAYLWRKLKQLVLIALIVAIFVVVVAPMSFRYSLFLQRSLLFMNWLNVPLFRNLSNPELDFGLNCTRNLYLDTQDGMKLGLWHVLPKSRLSDCDMGDIGRISSAAAFRDDRPIVYYLHGNGGARGGPHRKELFKVLAYSDSLDYHVVAIDYRGFGDSSDVTPSVPGLTSDAATGYFWLLQEAGGNTSRITIWGHSLGTGIAANLVSSLQVRDQPNGLLLESPFSSIGEAIQMHPLSVAVNWLPYFDDCFVTPIVSNDQLNFDSVSRMSEVHCPLLILHAVDDVIVPYPLGVKLYQEALKRRPKSSISKSPPAQMVSFAASHGYGHKNIYKDAEIPKIVADFVRHNWINSPTRN